MVAYPIPWGFGADLSEGYVDMFKSREARAGEFLYGTDIETFEEEEAAKEKERVQLLDKALASASLTREKVGYLDDLH